MRRFIKFALSLWLLINCLIVEIICINNVLIARN